MAKSSAQLPRVGRCCATLPACGGGIGQSRSRTRDYVEDAADGSTIEIVRRGRSVARMEPARLSTLTVMLLLDALFGGLLMHCLTTPPSRTAELADNADAYTVALVDFVLASVTGPTSGA